MPGVIPGKIDVQVDGPFWEMKRSITRRGDQVFVQNQSFMVGEEARGRGIGTKVLLSQAIAGTRLGWTQIQTNADGSAEGPQNGYWTWPRLGFDGPLNEMHREGIPPALADAKTVRDLMKTEEGRDWWKQSGSTIAVGFDLGRDSQNLRVLIQYAQAKGLL